MRPSKRRIDLFGPIANRTTLEQGTTRAEKNGFYNSTQPHAVARMPLRADTFYFCVHSYIKKHKLREWLTVDEARDLLKNRKIGKADKRQSMSVYFGDRSMTIGVSEPNLLLDLTAGALRTVAEAIVGVSGAPRRPRPFESSDVVHLPNSSRPAIGPVRKRKRSWGIRRYT